MRMNERLDLGELTVVVACVNNCALLLRMACNMKVVQEAAQLVSKEKNLPQWM